MADRLLVLVPHEHTHAPRSILEQARKLGPDATEMRAIKHTMEFIAPELPTNVCKVRAVKDIMPLIAYCMCIAQRAPAQLPGDHWPCKPALLNGQER